VQLEQSFLIPVTVRAAWEVLLDIEQVASCMPGAVLDAMDGDEFTGRVKVKLGPINLTYAGTASFVERDEASHRVVINAQGRDRRGNSTATAVISARLTPEGDATRVDVVTDLDITGRPAQFGRGAMSDVADKLLGQFADELTARLTAAQEAGVVDVPRTVSGADPTPEMTAPTPLEFDADAVADAARPAGGRATADPEPIDLVNLVGSSLSDRLRRPAMLAVGILVFALIGTLARRGRRTVHDLTSA
jgi:carbon monoxide dehydrogenase subunit G